MTKTDKAYGQKTKMLGIPVPDYGDAIWPELELKKYQIIENMLLAAMRGKNNSVFEEGSYVVRRGEDGKWCVSLSATGASPSVTGTIGGAYFSAPSSVSWEGLEDGRTYFLYLRGSSKTFLDSRDVRPVASTTRLSDTVSVLVAKVSTVNKEAKLDLRPHGKVSAKDWHRHVADTENPHGDKFVQDEIMVRRRIAFDDGMVLSVAGVDVPCAEIAEAFQEMRRQAYEVIEFVTGGPEGVVLSGHGRVSFVSVSRSCSGARDFSDNLAGEVAIGYCGVDAAVARPDQFIVRNSGQIGVSMKALVVCG